MLSGLGVAHGDQVVFRGNYWKDRNTRVVQPEADLSKELPSGTIVGAHYLLDAITSASVAAGASSDVPFSELRNEVGLRLGQRIGPALVTGGYSYSSESDYWAHLANLSAVVDLFQKNTTLGLAASYGSDSVGRRIPGPAFVPVGGLQSFQLIASATQTLSRTALASFSYELGVLGFGSSTGSVTGNPNKDTGYQSNPYRVVRGDYENAPFQRVRQALAAGLQLYVPTGQRLVPYVAFHPAYRLYWDDWGIVAHTPELRTYLPIGPIEIRITGRYYTQRAASFWRQGADGKPDYRAYGNQGAACTGCDAAASRKPGALFATIDPKLGPFDAMLLEARVLLKLNFVGRLRGLPLASWLGAGALELSYGHYFDDNFAHIQFGDGDLAGLSLSFPL